MKIMLFWDGQRGVVIKLPGARPLEEIGGAAGRRGAADAVRAAPAGPGAGAGGRGLRGGGVQRLEHPGPAYEALLCHDRLRGASGVSAGLYGQPQSSF